MKVLMLGLGLALLCSVCAEHQCSGDDRHLEGTWHVIGIGTNSFYESTRDGFMKIIFASLFLPEERKLKVTSYFPMESGCKKVEIEFEKMEDGTYHNTSESGKTTIEIVKTNCEDYAIAIVKVEKDEKTTILVILFSKNSEVSPEIKQQLTTIGESQGMMSDNIVFFSSGVACQDEA
ncbi:neutrophil gelatinase-associated lipocalin-like [Heteronotia binoei]|uniref:neutrophil gelatinase-associated lipocalin-like n=1 Tax=Heteronotia binoei TaxID=13085 RepID=UPI002930E42F|nr:neutrophil gelatinase-associated lipocalin-like [Heteronotia binoei]